MEDVLTTHNVYTQRLKITVVVVWVWQNSKASSITINQPERHAMTNKQSVIERYKPKKPTALQICQSPQFTQQNTTKKGRGTTVPCQLHSWNSILVWCSQKQVVWSLQPYEREKHSWWIGQPSWWLGITKNEMRNKSIRKSLEGEATIETIHEHKVHSFFTNKKKISFLLMK